MTGHMRLEGMAETRGRSGICLGNQIRAGHRSWDKVRATEWARSIFLGQRNSPGRGMKIPSHGYLSRSQVVIQQGSRSQGDAKTWGGDEQRMSMDEGMERKDLGPGRRCI